MLFIGKEIGPQMLSIKDLSVEGLFKVGAELIEKEILGEAIKYWEEIVKRRETTIEEKAEALWYLGTAYSEVDMSQAIGYFEQALEIKGDSERLNQFKTSIKGDLTYLLAQHSSSE